MWLAHSLICDVTDPEDGVNQPDAAVLTPELTH